MDKYEYRLKAEQIETQVKKKDYQAAAKIADTVDWRRVKNLNMLYMVSEIYEKTERYGECMEILDMAYDRAPVGRMLLYRMTEVCTKMHNFEEAISLYREFVKAAPHDQSRFILKYQIYRERGSSVEDQIKILNEYKTHEYQEKWAYELAALYDEAGMPEECVRECDELILWFSEGEYVMKALELKMKYEPLTVSQQEKYNYQRLGAVSDLPEEGGGEPELPGFDSSKFSTVNLQAELAENLDELLKEDATIDLPDLELAGAEGAAEPEEEPEAEPEEDLREDATIELPDLGLDGDKPEEDTGEESEGEPEEDLREDATIELPDLGLAGDDGAADAEERPEKSLANVSQKSFLENATTELPVLGAEKKAAEPEEEKKDTGLDGKDADAQFTGPISIDDILGEWEQKKAQTEAKLEAAAQTEKVRREKVKQETAELMKLITGASEDLPKDVRRILEEIDEEHRISEESVVTEDDLPPDLDAEEEPEAELNIESLEDEEERGASGRRENLPEESSGNMIQDLKRSLASKVSEGAVSAGHLTREQARLFAYFTSVQGMSEQLSVLFKEAYQGSRTSSSSGNLTITGERGNGKTTLAIDIVKALQKQDRIGGKRLAKISGQKLNTKDIYDVLTRLKGGALIVESAGGISDATMMAMSLAMETDTGGLVVILEDTAEEIQKLFLRNRNFASKFDHTIDIPVFTNDELVAFGKSYALEQEYSFDEFGILALYDRIGSRQTNDHLVTVAEVKEIIDDAIEHAEKGGIRHLIDRVTRKSVDEFGNRLIREADFTE